MDITRLDVVKWTSIIRLRIQKQSLIILVLLPYIVDLMYDLWLNWMVQKHRYKNNNQAVFPIILVPVMLCLMFVQYYCLEIIDYKLWFVCYIYQAILIVDQYYCLIVNVNQNVVQEMNQIQEQH